MFLGRPWFNSLVKFVNSELVCLPPVGIFKAIMFSWYVCFFQLMRYACELATCRYAHWPLWTKAFEHIFNCLNYHPVKDKLIGDVNNIFLFLYNTKPIETMLSCVCTVIEHRRRQNGGYEHQWHTWLSPRVPLFRSYHILMSSLIYYRTDARQRELSCYTLIVNQIEDNVSCFLRKSWVNFSGL